MHIFPSVTTWCFKAQVTCWSVMKTDNLLNIIKGNFCNMQNKNTHENYINKWEIFHSEFDFYQKPQLYYYYCYLFIYFHYSTHLAHHITGFTTIIYLFTFIKAVINPPWQTYSVVSFPKTPCLMKYQIELSSAAFPLLCQPVAICKCSGWSKKHSEIQVSCSVMISGI